MDMDRGMAAARRIKRREPMPATKADRLQHLLIRTFGRSVTKLRRQQKRSQQLQLGDMADLSPHAFGPAERVVANVTFDVVARLAACLVTIPAELLTDNYQIEPSHNCYLDEHASLARLYSVGISIGMR
jgi:transcriptional regulator with XRE-family HTH domain